MCRCHTPRTLGTCKRSWTEPPCRGRPRRSLPIVLFSHRNLSGPRNSTDEARHWGRRIFTECVFWRSIILLELFYCSWRPNSCALSHHFFRLATVQALKCSVIHFSHSYQLHRKDGFSISRYWLCTLCRYQPLYSKVIPCLSVVLLGAPLRPL